MKNMMETIYTVVGAISIAFWTLVAVVILAEVATAIISVIPTTILIILGVFAFFSIRGIYRIVRS